MDALDPKACVEILLELSNSGNYYRNLSFNLNDKLTSLAQETTDLKVENEKLQQEKIRILPTSVENLKASTIVKYKLFEAVNKIRGFFSGISQLSSGIAPRSYLNLINRKFMVENRSLNQVFQKEIRIILKRNACSGLKFVFYSKYT